MPKNRKPAGLTPAQLEIVGQFNDFAFENPKLTFAQVARKALGTNPFPRTLIGEKFKRECRKIFDRERDA